MVLADSEIRAAQLCALNWRDLDLRTCQLLVRSSKERKDRVTSVGVQTLRTLRRYRRSLERSLALDGPMIRGHTRPRLTPNAFAHFVRRLSLAAGVKVTPHALRRTFALMSLRNGMDLARLSPFARQTNQFGHIQQKTIEKPRVWDRFGLWCRPWYLSNVHEHVRMEACI